MSFQLTPSTLEPAFVPESPKCPLASAVLTGISDGRTYTFKKGALQASQVIAIATLAYLFFDSMLAPSENSKIVADFSVFGSIFLIAVGAGREILHCSRHFKDDKKGILNPFTLLMLALFGGLLTTQISYSKAKGVIRRVDEDNAAFNRSLISCNDFMIQNAGLLTASPCVPCPYSEEGYIGPLNMTIMQQVIKDFQAIVCLSSENSAYFDDLTNINANQTNGTYPCSAEDFNLSNQTKPSRSVQAYSQLFNIRIPMLFNALFMNETCKEIRGFGTQAFSLSDLCGSFFDDPSTIGEFDYNMIKCVTPELEAYMKKYVEEIEQFIQSSGEITEAYETIDKAPLDTLWTSTAISTALAIAYKFVKYKFQQRDVNRPLLNG